jgi:hypothetical protein
MITVQPERLLTSFKLKLVKLQKSEVKRGVLTITPRMENKRRRQAWRHENDARPGVGTGDFVRSNAADVSSSNDENCITAAN